MEPDQRVTDMLATMAAAMTEFGVGRSEAFQAMWSHGDDVTIFGALGGTARGWAEVEPRSAWAARQTSSPPFKAEAREFDYTLISAVFGADLGHTVWLENLDGTVWSGLRVTHLFRLEDDQWKIVHRHADPLVDVALPAPDPAS